jgi:hypothetical protein
MFCPCCLHLASFALPQTSNATACLSKLLEQEAFLFEEKRQQEQIGIAAAEAARRRLAQVRALLTNY